MLLLSDGRLDDGSVKGVRDQADDKVVLGELGIQGLVVGNIERDGSGILNAGRERLGRFEGPACCGSVSGLTVDDRSGRGETYQQSRRFPSRRGYRGSVS